MKTILLEGSVLSKQVANGISNYLSNLVLYSSQPEPALNFNTRVMVRNGYDKNIFIKELRLPKSKFLLVSERDFFNSLIFGRLSESVDLFHSPYMFLPPKGSKRFNLLTVHDLINLENPFNLRNKSREIMLRMAISRADHFICISNSTKQKLKEHFPRLSEEQLHTIYQGIDGLFLSSLEGEAAEIALGEPYLLYVGQRSGYKNFNSLLRFLALTSWKSKLNVLCVGGGNFTLKESQDIESYKLKNVVKHVGYTTNLQLKYLYENAFALAYTSLHEGFGLPIIEAMACGCAVLCGNFSSMKEVSSNHAILMNDFSVESFENALAGVTEFTQKRKSEARVYAQQFTWEKTSNNTIKLYGDLLGV
ncbi:MAG TPA: glycosyltransferase family 1 protein [Ohtaekwangia sp.]|nr:glycosyltransferase family 1 protein [Ohtaekwangia sp.]